MGSSWTARRIAATVASVLALAIVAGVLGFSFALHRSPWQIITGQFVPQPQELFGKDHALVLVEGLDYDYNDKDEEYSTHSRSDVIKAINLDFRTRKVYVLDVPRDMEATLPNGTQAKINEAQSEGGVHEAEAVISKWLGIPGFDRYVILRVNTTKDLIDAVGGVDVFVKNSDCIRSPHDCTNGALDYDDTWGHLHIHLKPGMQHLNGDEAVGYARFRHDFCGDPCRIERQDQVVKAVVAKLRNDKFNTLVHAADLLGVFRRDVDTNLTQEEQESLVRSFVDMPKGGLETKQVPYTADVTLADGGDAIVPNADARAQLVQSMLVNPPAPSPLPAQSDAAAIDPHTVRVEVKNGSGVAGAARRVAAMLARQGFTIAGVSNAARTDLATSEVHEHTKINDAGLKVRDALGAPAASIAVLDDAGGAPATSDVTVIVGTDIATKLVEQSTPQ